MKDESKTKEQLINELLEIRKRITKLDASDIECKHMEDKIHRDYHIQSAISSLLKRSLEPISLKEQLDYALDLIIHIPWLVHKSMGSIYLVEDDSAVLVMKVQRGFTEAHRSSCSKVPFGKCLCGLAASTRKIIFSDRIDNRHVIRYQSMPPHGHYCIPILSGKRVFGVIYLFLEEGYKRDQSVEEFLIAVANTLAGIIERKEAVEKIMKDYHIQGVINSILQISLEPISLEEQLERILDLIISIPWLSLQSKGLIYLVEDDPEVLVMKVQRRAIQAQLITCSKVPFGKCLCGRAASTRKIVFSDHIDNLHEINYQDMPPHGHYCIPVMSGDRILGVICLYIKQGHRRERMEEEFLSAVANALAGIIERKRAEEVLQNKDMQLEEKTHNLEEVNAALKVLLKQREEDKKEFEENILSNVKSLILPYVEKMKKSRLNPEHKRYIDLIRTHIDDIASPLAKNLSSRYLGLTPMEIRTVGLIKEGKTTKEIGDILNLSVNTIMFHRTNIRNKLGLKNEKINLRSYIQSLD